MASKENADTKPQKGCAKPSKRNGKSVHEETLALHIRAHSIPAPEREYRFCERRWRFDFCWPDRKLAVEIEGGVWSGGRHTRGSGFVADMAKYNRAALLGYTVLRVTGDMVRKGEAIELIREALQ